MEGGRYEMRGGRRVRVEDPTQPAEGTAAPVRPEPAGDAVPEAAPVPAPATSKVKGG